MTNAWFLTESAEASFVNIYNYTFRKWGEEQAERYAQGIFDKFDAIASRLTPWRPIAHEHGVSGFFTRYGKHHIFWCQFSDSQIGVVAILHDAMVKGDRLIAAFSELPPN